MNDADRKLLEADGWEIDCESPFELSHPDGSRATGQAAYTVLEYLRQSDKHWYVVTLKNGNVQSRNVRVLAESFNDAVAEAEGQAMPGFKATMVELDET